MPENTDTEKLMHDLTELAKSWRLRGFDINAIIAALGAGALVVFQAAGLTRDQVIGIVDHHYGNHARPTVQA